ncbi:unnamed protein product [Closterium sp. NIES-53]
MPVSLVFLSSLFPYPPFSPSSPHLLPPPAPNLECADMTAASGAIHAAPGGSQGHRPPVHLFVLTSQQPVVRFTQHQAAVKAIAWSPHQHGLLASGGGTADRCIRFWNTATATPLSWVDTGSQVGLSSSSFLS